MQTKLTSQIRATALSAFAFTSILIPSLAQANPRAIGITPVVIVDERGATDRNITRSPVDVVPTSVSRIPAPTPILLRNVNRSPLDIVPVTK